MKLNDNTLNVIKNFSLINPSLYFRQGAVQSTLATTKNVFAKATLDQEFDCDFCIYELNKFLSILHLMKEPELHITPEIVTIKSDRVTTRYTCADKNSITVPPEKQLELKTRDIQFDMSQEVFTNVCKAISVLGYKQFGIVGEEGKLCLQALNTENPTADVYSIDIGETDKQFAVTINSDFLKFLPSNYSVALSKKGNGGLAHFSNDTMEYFVAVEATSVWA